MSEQITIGSQRSRPSTLILLLIAVSTVILASCGGGSDSTSSAESADGTKQALGISGTAATVPGGWTGRAPKMEVINGITVPPEPAPSINNATLAGVDVNANGVRDDVERKIATKSAKLEDFNKGVALAKTYQEMVKAPISNRVDAIALLKRQNCVYLMSGAINKELVNPSSATNLPLMIANTTARKTILDKFNYELGGADAEEIQCN